MGHSHVDPPNPTKTTRTAAYAAVRLITLSRLTIANTNPNDTTATDVVMRLLLIEGFSAMITIWHDERGATCDRQHDGKHIIRKSIQERIQTLLFSCERFEVVRIIYHVNNPFPIPEDMDGEKYLNS
jgi:hypothetical protein